MCSFRSAVAALLAFTYLCTATAALPVVCSVECARTEGTGGKACHRGTTAQAEKSCHRSKTVARCSMHGSRDGVGRCCSMNGEDQQATAQLILSLMGTAFLVPQTVGLFPAPTVARLADAPSSAPLDRFSNPLTPPPRA